MNFIFDSIDLKLFLIGIYEDCIACKKIILTIHTIYILFRIVNYTMRTNNIKVYL